MADRISETIPEPGRKFLPRREIANWLGEKPAAALLHYALENAHRFAPSTVDGGGMPARVDSAFRASTLLNDLGPHRAFLEQKIREILPWLEQEIGGFSLPPKAMRLELVAHGDGAHFLPHVDTSTGNEALEHRTRRRLSIVYYLHRQPKAFTGGNLRFYSLDGQSWDDVAPQHDALVAFPSWAQHSVEPVAVPSHAFQDSRFAVNAWIYE